MEAQYIKIDENGTKFYFKDKAMTKRHRVDAPAVEWSQGVKEWYINGKLHREDGAAIECTDGYKAWHLEGKKYTQAEFNAKIAPVKELTVADIEKLLGHRVKIVKQ